MSLNKVKICVRCGKDKGCKEDCCVYGVCYGKHDFNVATKEQCKGLNCKEHYGEDHFPPKQDTTDWEEEFEYMERNHGWIPEHKEAIKSFISQVRQKAQQEERERIRQFMAEKDWHGSGVAMVEDYIRSLSNQ